MSTATNTATKKAIVQRMVTAINQQNLAEIDAVFAPDLAQQMIGK